MQCLQVYLIIYTSETWKTKQFLTSDGKIGVVFVNVRLFFVRLHAINCLVVAIWRPWRSPLKQYNVFVTNWLAKKNCEFMIILNLWLMHDLCMICYVMNSWQHFFGPVLVMDMQTPPPPLKRSRLHFLVQIVAQCSETN